MKLASFLRHVALLLTIACTSQAAFATPVRLTLTDTNNVVIDSFTLDTSAGRPDGAGTPPYLLFDITNDLLGFNAVFFGDSSTGGWMGIGNLCCGGNVVAQQISEFFSPALFSGNGLNADFVVGGSYVATSGNTLSVSAIPEPGSLSLVGASIAGLLVLRRRRNS